VVQITTDRKETDMETKKNVLLVHGAWADASCWSKVILLLDKKGLNVSAAQLPLTSLEDDIAVTKHALAALKGPTVLVGHSYGGAVITGAANDEPNVTALVYIAGFGLDEGESIDGLSKQGPATPGAAQIRPDDQGFLWIDRDGFAKVFAADADPAETRVMAVVQKPLSLKAFTAKSGPPAWKHIPSWYLVSLNDQLIPPSAEELMAKRMGATTRKIDSSHASMVSHSNEVADIIGAAAEVNVAAAAPALK
jgi:pimeloyl-ACP methyl ester carboxylesterase